MIVYPLRFLLRITAPRPSDFDMDQDVDWDDLGIFVANWLPSRPRPSDFDMDQDVDWDDLGIFVANWLRDDCGIPDWCAGTDLDMSTEVNFFDYAEFTRCWSGP